MISIELVDVNGQPTSTWRLGNVKPGEKRKNTDPDDPGTSILHHIKNLSSVSVGIDVGYVSYEGCAAGSEPGSDQFATLLCNAGAYGIIGPIPPGIGDSISLPYSLKPTHRTPLPLMYCSPTELTEGIEGMDVIYDIRAYKAVK